MIVNSRAETERLEGVDVARIEADRRSEVKEAASMEAEMWASTEAAGVSVEIQATTEEDRIVTNVAQLKHKGKLSWE